MLLTVYGYRRRTSNKKRGATSGSLPGTELARNKTVYDVEAGRQRRTKSLLTGRAPRLEWTSASAWDPRES